MTNGLGSSQSFNAEQCLITVIRKWRRSVDDGGQSRYPYQ